MTWYDGETGVLGFLRLFYCLFLVLKVAEWYKGKMVLGGSGKVSFGRRIRANKGGPLSPYSE